MQFNNGIFVTPPRFQGEEFQAYENERAMLRNSVAELNFVCWRWLLACGHEVPLEGALSLLAELRARGEQLSVDLNLLYSWVQILGTTKPEEARQVFYDCNKFIYILYENLHNYVSKNTKRPTR